MIERVHSGTEHILPKITREHLADAFADFYTLPSYFDVAVLPDADGMLKFTEDYHQSVEAIRDKIYGYPDMTNEQAETADRSFLGNTFASSGGVEARMVLAGLKPVSYTGSVYQPDLDMRGRYGEIPHSLISATSLVTHTDNFPDNGFMTGMLAPLQSERSITGFLYNKTAVKKIADLHAGLLEALGYDASRSADELMHDVFDVGDPVAESILMGYAPLTAIFFYLVAPIDLDECTRSMVVADKYGGAYRRNSYWESLGKLLDDEQLELCLRLVAEPEYVRSLGILHDGTRNEDYVYRTAANMKVQMAWETSGMNDYLRQMRNTLRPDAPNAGYPHTLL